MQHLDMSAFVVDRSPSDNAATIDTDAVCDIHGVVNHHGPMILSSGPLYSYSAVSREKRVTHRNGQTSSTPMSHRLHHLRTHICCFMCAEHQGQRLAADGGDDSCVIAGDVSKCQSDACDVGRDEDGSF